MPILPMQRQDIVDALTALITELKSTNTKASFRIVGVAALALKYFERPATTDIDSLGFRGFKSLRPHYYTSFGRKRDAQRPVSRSGRVPPPPNGRDAGIASP